MNLMGIEDYKAGRKLALLKYLKVLRMVIGLSVRVRMWSWGTCNGRCGRRVYDKRTDRDLLSRSPQRGQLRGKG